MDDFIVHVNTFHKVMNKLDKFLKRCKEHNLSLRNEKCYMMMSEGIVLGHYLPSAGI